ncbi:MAG TPA: hypothetical protein VGR29_10400, partial [Thermomicrobiales bacterium]|nr:hypothetical protein [Thermomicrobiales bacterium]
VAQPTSPPLLRSSIHPNRGLSLLRFATRSIRRAGRATVIGSASFATELQPLGETFQVFKYITWPVAA